MGISDKARKRLWAKSGNRCVICKEELFQEADSETIAVNLGEECHIISSKKTGPRHSSGLQEYDAYDNLLLLCRNHHKEIDTLTETYPEELLRYMKTIHENWVSETLKPNRSGVEKQIPKFLKRIISGKELYKILADTHGSYMDYDEQDDSAENEYIGSALQVFTDYADLTGMIPLEPAQQVNISTELKDLLNEMETRGYALFADRSVESITLDSNTHNNWSIATLVVKKI